MKAAFSIKEIYEILSEQIPVSLRTIERRAETEKWRYINGKGRGKNGTVRNYLVKRLPVDVRNSIAVFCKKQKELVPSGSEEQHKKALKVQEERAYFKTELTKSYVACLEKAKHGQKGRAKEIFIMTYNLGEAGSYPVIFRELGKIDENGKTLSAWKKKLENNMWNPDCLVDHRGYSLKGKREVTPEHAEIILSYVKSQYNTPGKPKAEIIRHCIAIMEQKGIKALSESTFLRWLNDWIEYNYDDWVFWRHGEKGLNDMVANPISRDYDLIEVGDILVADGHTLNFEIINPFTGKPKRMTLVAFSDMKSGFLCGWEIMPTENIDSISVALRRSILRLGKMPKCVYMDNGRAFKASYFTGVKDFNQTKLPGLYSKLGIQVITAKPYHGQTKPIERFFRTFGELERMAPTFTGESIQNKPVWRNRGEKLHRMIHEKTTRGVTPTIVDAHLVIGKWLDMWCRRKQGTESKLAGKTPLEVFEPGVGPGVNPLELRSLMLVEEKRKIQRRGIRLFGKDNWYYHPNLYGRTHKVIIYFDLQNKDSILVYDGSDEKFICEATIQKGVHPAASILGTEADQAELQRQLELQSALKKKTVINARELVETQIIPETRRRIEQSGFTLSEGDFKKIPESTRTLTKGEKEKIKADFEELERLHKEEEKAEVIELESFELESESYDSIELDQMDRADKYEKLIEREIQGKELSDEHKAFLKYFEDSYEYKENEIYFEEKKMNLVYLKTKSG